LIGSSPSGISLDNTGTWFQSRRWCIWPAWRQALRAGSAHQSCSRTTLGRRADWDAGIGRTCCAAARAIDVIAFCA